VGATIPSQELQCAGPARGAAAWFWYEGGKLAVLPVGQHALGIDGDHQAEISHKQLQ
jgi:hypothetical protein